MHFPLLIFTDLDGTLLDHHTYSFRGAEETLRRLRRLTIPLVLTSSKTKAEILKLQGALGLDEPFIAENGGGFFLPPGHTLLKYKNLEIVDRLHGKRFGLPYSLIREVFLAVQPKYQIRGFGDMTTEEVMAATGLSRENALLAKERDFSEPFLFLAEPRLEELQKELSDHGLQVTRGGRFYHLMAAGQDKGLAVAAVTRLFQDDCPERIVTVGLGDAENDFSMLRVVDMPVLVPRPDGSFANLELPELRRAPYPGSRGWGDVIARILDDFQSAGSLSTFA